MEWVKKRKSAQKDWVQVEAVENRERVRLEWGAVEKKGKKVEMKGCGR